MDNDTQDIDFSKLQFISDVRKDENIIWIVFDHNHDLIRGLKMRVLMKWDNLVQLWFVKDDKKIRSLLNFKTRTVGDVLLNKIDPINKNEFFRFEDQLILKGYSNNTIRTYCTEFAQLLYVLNDFPVVDLCEDKLKSYILYCAKELQLSENQIHSRMNAIKFYFEKVLMREQFLLNIPRPKKPQLLPKSLNEAEIQKIIDVTENIKHRIILKLCYGMGLRVSEIVKIKIEDIDSKKMTVFISLAKGKKDRYVNLPQSILVELRAYYKEYRPETYLFEGHDHDQYSVRSAQSVFKNAMKKAKIYKKVGIHSLRHSYATHLLEYGTDISHIQKLLGHNNIKTTLIYTQVTDKNLAQITSPLDRLSSNK